MIFVCQPQRALTIKDRSGCDIQEEIVSDDYICFFLKWHHLNIETIHCVGTV